MEAPHQFVDAHLHLQDERIWPQRDAVLSRARDRGVGRLICNGTCESDWPRVKELAAQEEGVTACFGLHPWDVAERSPSWMTELRKYLSDPNAHVGEVGLDRHFVEGDYVDQETVFETQLALAAELKRTVTVHCVKAWDRLEGILRAHGGVSEHVVLHSFGGSLDLMKRFLDLGVTISFSPPLVQASRDKLREAFKSCPSDRFVLETDSPDLFRRALLALEDHESGLCTDGLNEPAAVPRLYEAAAEIRGVALEPLVASVSHNVERLWRGVVF